ncbi:MAG: 50S ribosomal protein L21 [Elusimicrobia bacterium]|nr:50S ribosomal protein L21 [Elusimicrobiota bacterium]MBU2615010.1 50S ribosomal protein L21 [Elusimicrobiota bacterium]
MYAMVLIGSRQYKVSEGEEILVDKISSKLGAEITLENVLMVKKENESVFGNPIIKNAKVIAEVVDQTRGPRIIAFKRRRKKGYKKTRGHREYLTGLKIKKIQVD